MDFASAILNVYLLFSVFTVGQKQLLYVLKKPVETQDTNFEQRKRLCEFLKIKDFQSLDFQSLDFQSLDFQSLDFQSLDYHSQEKELDNYDNIEELLFGNYNQDVPLPDGLENPEFNIANGVTITEGGIAEKQYINSQNRLRLFEYDEEFFTTYKNSQNDSNVVSINKNIISRVRYNSDYRLKDKIIWKNGTSINDSKMIRKIQYFYDESFLVNIIDEFTIDKKIVTTNFDQSKNPINVEYAHYIDDPVYLENKKKEEQKKVNNLSSTDNTNLETKEDNSKEQLEELKEIIPQIKIIDKKTERTFDVEGKILTEEETIFKEIEDPLNKNKKKTIKIIQRNVYEYTTKSTIPDLRFYENGKLRVATLYLDQNNYEETMYFENGYTVKTRYKEGKKISEIIYSGDSEIKRRRFD